MRCQPRNKGKGFILPAYAGLLDNTFGIAEPQGKGGLVPMNVFRRDTPLAKVWFVKASRNFLRSGVLTQKIPVLISGETDLIDNWRSVIMALAKANELSVIDNQITDPDNPTKNFEGFTIALKIEIDVAAEMEKIKSELSQVENQLAREVAKLDNESFMKKAPETVVSEVQRLVAAFASKKEQLSEQMDRLLKTRQ